MTYDPDQSQRFGGLPESRRGPRIIARRSVMDSDHRQWCSVEERELPDGRALFFVTEAGFVRLRPYPEHWMSLGDQELLALRDVVYDRSRPIPANAGAGLSRQTPKHAGPKRPLRILVVDDDDAARYVAKRTLQEVAEEVFEADSADTGVEMARLIKPDLILLDYMLPGASGAETIRRLRGDAELRSIPILLYTAHERAVSSDARQLVDAVLPKEEFSRDRALEAVMAVVRS